jgi:hypothetical protein
MQEQEINPSSNSRHVSGSSQTVRRQYSLSALVTKIKSWWPRSEGDQKMASTNPGVPAPSSSKIPEEKNGVLLTRAERAVYGSLLEVVERRKSAAETPRILVITDLAKDYDDLAAMVVLKELHRLGVVELLGFIANLEPAKDRALFGRGALDRLGMQEMRIVEGTTGFDNTKPEKKRHRLEDYEFACSFMASEKDKRFHVGEDPTKERLYGRAFLEDLCKNAKSTGQKFTLLLISSLEDIHNFSKEHEYLMEAAVSNIVLQGGYTISPDDGKLVAMDSANNNRYDPTAAKEFHALMQKLKIPSTVYTKTAAIAATLEPEVFNQLSQTQNEVGLYLWKVQKLQDLSFYRNASQKDPKKRFRSDLDQRNFLKTRTNWFDTHSDNDTYPVGDDVSNFTKVVVYDALAALGVSGNDALDALDVLDIPPLGDDFTGPARVKEAMERHLIVGVEGQSSGIKAPKMVTVLTALLKGSLISAPAVERARRGSKRNASSPHDQKLRRARPA